MIKLLSKCLLVVFLLAAAGICHSADPAAIRDVYVETVSGGVNINILLSRSCAQRNFMLDGPPRFVLDLMGVATPKETINIDKGIARTIRKAQFSDKPELIARLVVDLSGSVSGSEVQELGNSIIVKLCNAPAAGADTQKDTSGIVTAIQAPAESINTFDAEKELGIDISNIEVLAEKPVLKNEKASESASPNEYMFSIDDVLEVSVFGDEAMTREVIVRPDGMISFVLVGDLLARGLTPTQLSRQLEEKLSVYIKKPMVTVIVKKATKGRKEVFLLGEVRNPGSQELTEGMGILELLSKAGGLTENAFTKGIKILRKEPSPGAISINLNEIIDGDFSKNEALKPGDIVYVPRSEGAKGIFILGQVEKPGMYKTEDAPTIIELVSHAGGFKENAVPSSVKVIRGEPGKPEVLSADIDLFINTGDMSTNIALQPGDIVYVPKSFISNMNKFFSDILPTIQFVYYGYSLGKGIVGVP